MTGVVQRRSEVTVERAMQALALWSGSARKASEALEREFGETIAPSTLQDWKNHLYPERYREAQRTVLDRVWERTADEWRTVTQNAAELSNELLDATRHKLRSDGDPKDIKALAGAAKDSTFAGGIAHDKARVTDGKATEIHLELGVEDLVRLIGKEFGPVLPVAVDTTAEEIHPSPHASEPTNTHAPTS